MKAVPTKPEWEGMAYVVIHEPESSLRQRGIGGIAAGFKDVYVTLKNTCSGKECGGIVKTIQPGGKGINEIDPCLLKDLSAGADDDIEVLPLVPVAAKRVRLAVSKSDINGGELKKLCGTYLQRHPLSKGQRKNIYLFTGEKVTAEIAEVLPADLAVFTPATEIALDAGKAVSGGLDEIGGLENEKKLIRERILLPLTQPEFFASHGILPPRGVLLSGPSGCGKTMIARAIGEEIKANFVEINCSEVFNALIGESEKLIREKFEQAKAKTPAIILIDEIDAIGSSRMQSRVEVERRVVTTLLTEMDGLRSVGNVVVVATTNIPGVLDPALRRPGRFDYEIRVGVPDRKGRLDILNKMTSHMSLGPDVDMGEIARRTSGFVGADLMMLCREVAFEALTEDKAKAGEKKDAAAAGGSVITARNFESALKRVKPSGLREFAVEVPTGLGWGDVGGLKAIKQTLIQEIVQVLKNPESFEKVGITPVRGLLLYGPPGTGKTLLARIIANEAEANFINIKGPELLSKWYGESEERIRNLFSKARESSPCIIFFDEIDAISASREGISINASDRVVNQMLTEMDGFAGSRNVCVIAATNRVELIDPALLRPGRFDYQILVPLPDEAERREIFGIHLKSKPLADGIDFGELASMSKEFSGAHIFEACRRAALAAFREKNFTAEDTKVEMRHLREAIDAVTESIKKIEKPRIGFDTDRR